MFVRLQVRDDIPLAVESVELGLRLFYDPRLSAIGALSCSSWLTIT